ncbi:ATP-binding cassette domain-containing protein [bacterium]|nr:ATP-binding cassette domain-containing protein [bacterium]
MWKIARARQPLPIRTASKRRGKKPWTRLPSGKSTIAKIVAGLYEPWSGEIAFDGQLKSQLPPAVITNSVAMIEQDILLFTGSVRDNLTLWDSTIPERNLMQACRDACIHDVVQAMPGGYSADLREGASNLSGGQRQRIALARAFLSDPRILILDDSTSAIDSATEDEIQKAIRRAQQGRTTLLITHRLSQIRWADHTLVLDEGKIIAYGSHNELLRTSPQYRRIFARYDAALPPLVTANTPLSAQ